MSTNTTNISVNEFYEKWSCVDAEQDIWTSNTNKCKVIFESDEYIVVKFL